MIIYSTARELESFIIFENYAQLVISDIIDNIRFTSHEGVEGVLMWGFWDKAHWKPNAAIVNGDDFVINKAGETYIR